MKPLLSQSPPENHTHYQRHIYQQQHPQSQGLPLTQQPIPNSQSLPVQQQQQQVTAQPPSAVFVTPIYPIIGTDGYVAPSSAGFSQGGPPHQAPTVLRGVQSTAPPTPPQQQEINKMNQPPPQTMYVSAGGTNGATNVRQNQQNMFRGSSAASNQRASRHSIPIQPAPFISQQLPTMMVQSPTYHPPYTTQRQPTNQLFQASQQYQLQQSYPTNYHGYGPIIYSLQQQRSVGVPTGIIQAGAPGLGGPAAAQQHLPMQSSTLLTSIPTTSATPTNTTTCGKRRTYAIKIVDPNTNRDIFELERSKLQTTSNTTNPEVNYTESICQPGNAIGGTTQGAPDPNTSVPDTLLPNVSLVTCNTNNVQGTFIDLMNQHKISAVLPPPTQPQTSPSINESLLQTPVVSAISDGPSVEIPPKQQTSKLKRSSKIAESVYSQEIGEKPDDLKDQPLPSSVAATETDTITQENQQKILKTGDDLADSLQNHGDISGRKELIATTHKTQPRISFTDNIHQSMSSMKSTAPQHSHHQKQYDQQKITTTERSGISDSDRRNANSINIDIENLHCSKNIKSTTIEAIDVTGADTKNAAVTAFCETSISQVVHKENNRKNLSITNNNQMKTGMANAGGSNRVQREKDKNHHQQHLQYQQLGYSNNNINSLNNNTNNSSDSYCNNNTANTSVVSSTNLVGSNDNRNRISAENIFPSSSYNNSLNISNIGRVAALNTSKGKLDKNKIGEKLDHLATGSKLNANNTNSLEKNNKRTGDKSESSSNKGSHQQQKHQRQQQQKSLAKDNQMDCIGNSPGSMSVTRKTAWSSAPTTLLEFAKSGTNANSQGTITSPVDCNAESESSTAKSIQNQPLFDEIERIRIPAVSSPKEEVTGTDLTDVTASNKSDAEFVQVLTLLAQIPSQSESAEACLSQNSDENSKKTNANLHVTLNIPTSVQSCDVTCIVSDKEQVSNHQATNFGIKEVKRSEDFIPIDVENHCEYDKDYATPILNMAQSTNSNTMKKCSVITPKITANGLKSYDRQQLLDLRYASLSKKKPNINSALSILDMGIKSNQASMMPLFALSPSNKRSQSIANSGIAKGSSSSGSHQFLKQSSMSGVNAKTNSKGSKSGMIHVSLSLREDVKLNESENAWRPTRLKRDENISESERSKDELSRQVRGILNKLTPERFNTLVSQLMKLKIDTQDKIKIVMELIFEKAIDEPNFSMSYARLCQVLGDGNQSLVDSKRDGTKNEKDSKIAFFKIALLSKTEREFFDHVLNVAAKEAKLEPLMAKLKECSDPESKLELQEAVEEEERKIRRRAGGTVRFIGELFNIDMLTVQILNDYIKHLIVPGSEDKLECLCKLLTTVGEKVDALSVKDNCSLNTAFKKMQNIVDRKTSAAKQLSSRVRFMLQDVIDLRKNKWQSKRNDMNPKTMEQIQKETESEQYNNQIMNLTMIPSKKDDRRFGVGGNSSSGNVNNSNLQMNSGNGGYYAKNNRQQSSDNEGWHTKISKSSRTFDATKLGQYCSDFDNSKINEERTLGDSSQYLWNTRNKQNESHKQTTDTTNSFAVLSSLDKGKGSNNGPRNRGSYSKNSMERDRYDGRGSRDKSIHGSRENSMSRISNRNTNMTRNSGPTHSYSNAHSHSSSRATKSEILSGTSNSERLLAETSVINKLNEDPVKHLEVLINEMVITAIETSFTEAIKLGEIIPEKYRTELMKIIFTSYLHLSRTKVKHRKIAAEIVTELYNKKILTTDHIINGYKQFTEDASDIFIDVPELWRYVFQFLGPLLHQGMLELKELWNDNLVKANMGELFLRHLFVYFIQEQGPNYTREMWNSSGLTWKMFLSNDDPSEFIKDNKLEFIEKEHVPSPIYGEPNMSNMMAKIEKLLKEERNDYTIIDYINGNIDVVNKQFIRGLTTVVLENALKLSDKNTRLNRDKLCKSFGIPLLIRYIDSKEDLELECLYAIQILIHKLEHPPGVLHDVFGILYENDVISVDAFMKWRDSLEEPAGKGVAVKGLRNFFSSICRDSTDENN